MMRVLRPREHIPRNWRGGHKIARRSRDGAVNVGELTPAWFFPKPNLRWRVFTHIDPFQPPGTAPRAAPGVAHAHTSIPARAVYAFTARRSKAGRTHSALLLTMRFDFPFTRYDSIKSTFIIDNNCARHDCRVDIALFKGRRPAGGCMRRLTARLFHRCKIDY